MSRWEEMVTLWFVVAPEFSLYQFGGVMLSVEGFVLRPAECSDIWHGTLLGVQKMEVMKFHQSATRSTARYLSRYFPPWRIHSCVILRTMQSPSHPAILGLVN